MISDKEPNVIARSASGRTVSIALELEDSDGTYSRVYFVAPVEEAPSESMVCAFYSCLLETPVNECGTPGCLVPTPTPAPEVEGGLEVFEDSEVMPEAAGDLSDPQLSFSDL